jgi:hypothetical protein
MEDSTQRGWEDITVDASFRVTAGNFGASTKGIAG